MRSHFRTICTVGREKDGQRLSLNSFHFFSCYIYFKGRRFAPPVVLHVLFCFLSNQRDVFKSTKIKRPM